VDLLGDPYLIADTDTQGLHRTSYRGTSSSKNLRLMPEPLSAWQT